MIISNYLADMKNNNSMNTMSLHLKFLNKTISEYELRTAIQYQTMSESTKTSFETLVQEFCLMYNRIKERPFEITTEMIFNNSYHMHVVIRRFVSHIKKKWGCCPSWANEGKYVGRGVWDLPLLKNAVLEQIRVSRLPRRLCNNTVLERSRRLCNNMNGTMSNMFEMCKAMADLTPHSHAQALLISLKRTAPKLYAVNDVVSQLNSYVKLGEFTEDDFRDIMMSDKGLLVIRLYLSWWAMDCENFRSTKKRKRRGNVFSHQRAKRRRAFFTKREKERLREYNRKKKY